MKEATSSKQITIFFSSKYDGIAKKKLENVMFIGCFAVLILL